MAERKAMTGEGFNNVVMLACWRYGMLTFNGLMVFGVYYFMEIPVGLQNEMTDNDNPFIGSNNTINQRNCKVCLGLGEFRYNFLFSVTRWASAVVCLPSGFMIDRLGNGRSAILFSTLVFLGSVLFAVGASSHPPVTTSMYILMLTGYGLLAFGDTALRFVQARVVSHCFPEATLTALAFGFFGYIGQGISLYTTPIIHTAIGLLPAVWIGPVSCGFGVSCAVGLAFLLQLLPPVKVEEHEGNNILTMNVLRGLPGSFWLLTMTIGFTGLCWIVKQANLPECLELQHGYTMTEASHIAGIAPLTFLVCPFVCLLLKEIDCDGIMHTFVLVWVSCLYVLLGFFPSVNIIFISMADGIGIGMVSVMTWQVLVVLSPASYVGTLCGLVYSVRNFTTALVFIAAGYILQRGNAINNDEALRHYQHLFIMLIILSLAGIACGVAMNALDIRTGGVLNSRIRRWQQSNIETTELISKADPSNKYCGSRHSKNSDQF